VTRQRVLLVPWITELEWRIRPLLEEWADVASYDCPGVGDEPPVDPHDADAIVGRGLAELDRRGWDRCIIAGDEFAAAIALRIASARPEVVEGLALGHACLRYDDHDADAPVNRDVMSGFNTLLDNDFRSWVRAYTQLTQGAYDDATMNLFLERVPPEVCAQHARVVDAFVLEVDVESELRDLNAPLLLAEHRDCLVFRRSGYDEAVAAFPDAAYVSTDEKPSCSPEFAAALRSFVPARTT
jgi:pimeloyl-ACP methyl ester carboxylesterase